MKKTYKEYIITAEPFNVEIISSILWELNIDGIYEEVNCLKVFAQDENVTVQSIESELLHLRENNLLRESAVQENYVVEKNWNEEYCCRKKCTRKNRYTYRSEYSFGISDD